ncbi:MAG: HipA N-terminal domain-containing protein [Bacteroidota bacterium]|nr:HipA N-terminal domain-containing protein [Bacteroidota bacterium]
MRKGKVYYKEHFAGIVTETDDGEFVFRYEENFVADHPKEFITFTMPVTSKHFTDKRLFPFFDGLIPEGWLLDIASNN